VPVANIGIFENWDSFSHFLREERKEEKKTNK
jgi:hypothetical protein